MTGLMTCRPGSRAMRIDMDKLFDDFFGLAQPKVEGTGTMWAPAVDVSEDIDNYIVKAELPGMAKEDIDLEIEGNALAIKGERKFEKATTGEDYHFVERSYGNFYRRFALPKNVNSEEIRAEYKDGILTITIPKREDVKPKKVEIKL